MNSNDFSHLSPLVTVVIPSYNHELYVAKAIESVLSQTYRNIELVVIDDGSRDQSVKIVSELADKHGFAFSARENRGLAKTLNEGIGLAKGKYICFLASDDFYLSHRVENAVLQLESSGDDVVAVYCDGYLVNDEGEKIERFGVKYSRPLAGDVYNNLIVANWIPALGVTYRIDRLKEFMFDERFKIEDWTLYLRMFKNKSNRLVFYDDFGFAYRWHESNFSKTSEAMSNEKKLMLEHFDDLGKYAKFKQQLKRRSFFSLQMTRLHNFYLLYLDLLRIIQGKSSSYHHSVLGLFLFYMLRIKRIVIERVNGFRYFGFLGLRKGIRVAGRVRIRGRKSNFKFGLKCRVFGDFNLVLDDAWRVRPSIVLGNNVTIEHNVYMNSHGGTISAGDNCHFGVGCVVQGKGGLKIGDGVLLGPATKIFSSNHVHNDLECIVSKAGETYRGITIGNHVWVGANCVIVDGAILGDHSVYGAGGVVIGNYAARTVNIAKKVRIADVIQGCP